MKGINLCNIEYVSLLQLLTSVVGRTETISWLVTIENSSFTYRNTQVFLTYTAGLYYIAKSWKVLSNYPGPNG